jgi:iron complex outermembrane recepter protein
MKKYFLIIIIIILGFNITLAQDNNLQNDTAGYELPFEILITAPRIEIPLKKSPFATFIITPELLKLMPKSIAADEPLKLVPGVKVDNQADGERLHLSIRGQGILSEHGIRGIKALLDGIPLNDPTGFTPDLYDVDWATLERIEVLRGPAGSLYGGSSSSGVLNILTQNSLSKKFNVDVLGTVGTNNFWKALVNISGKYNKYDYRVSYSGNMGNGYRQHANFKANNAYGKINIRPQKNIRITPVVMWTDFFNENPEGMNYNQYWQDPTQPNPDAIPRNEFMHTQRFTGGISGDLLINKMHDISFNASLRNTNYDESVVQSVLHRKMFTPGGSLQYTFSIGKGSFKNHFTVGGDYQYQSIDETRFEKFAGSPFESTNLLSDQKIKQTGYGVFATDRMDIYEKVSIMLSIRYDKINNEVTDNLKVPYDLSGKVDFSRTTGRVGIAYNPLKTLSIYANWGQGFLPPATEELLLNPDNYGGFNKNLTLSTSMGEEIGVRGNFGKYVVYDIAGFYLQTFNDFDRYRISSRPQETFYSNTDSSKRFGIEFYTKITPIKWLTFQTAYTYSNFKYTTTTNPRVIMDDTTIHKYKAENNYLPNSPEHQWYADLQINPIPSLSFGISSEVYSRSYIDGANLISESVPGFALFNLRGVYRWQQKGIVGEVSLNVRNVFDRTWIAFTEPDPGGNSYQPGSQREVFLGFRLIY